MYRINYSNGTEAYGVNFTEACREIQARPSTNWKADIRDWANGRCEVWLNGKMIATITPSK